MKRLIIIAAVLLMAQTPTVWAEPVSRIAAVVNDEIITTHQLDKKVAEELSAEARGEQLSAQEMETLRRNVLSGVIEEVLIKQRAAELGLNVTSEELDAAIKDVQRQNNMNREQLIEALKSEGIAFDDYRESISKQILQFKLLGREVQSKVEVTEDEILAYFREHIDEYREPPRVQLARITFPVPPKATVVQVEAIRAKAEEALARLWRGEDFYAVLLSASADRSAEGGDMGSFKDGELTPAFEKAVKKLKEGEITRIIEMQEGFHILKVVERTPGKIRQYDSVKGEIQKALAEKRTEERFKEWAKDLRKKANIEIRL